jgi:tRNA G37 N-methylase Trm5
MFIPKADNIINIDAGTPIATIIPLTENDVIIKSHLLSKEEFDKLMSASLYKHSFTHYYEKSKKIVDRQSKCPMGFFNRKN